MSDLVGVQQDGIVSVLFSRDIGQDWKAGGQNNARLNTVRFKIAELLYCDSLLDFHLVNPRFDI